MRQFISILLLLLLTASFVGCGSKSPSNDITTEKEPSTTTASTTTESTGESTESSTTAVTLTEATEANAKDEPTEATASKDDVKNFKPVTATGTFQGFADNNSVEIILDDGESEVFLVDDDSVIAALEKCEENATIRFTYTLKEGQVNKVITSIK